MEIRPVLPALARTGFALATLLGCSATSPGGVATDAAAGPDAGPHTLKPDAYERTGEFGNRGDGGSPTDARPTTDATPGPTDASPPASDGAPPRPDARRSDAGADAGPAALPEAGPALDAAPAPDAAPDPDAGPPVVADGDPVVRLCAFQDGCAPPATPFGGLGFCVDLTSLLDDAQRAGLTWTPARRVGPRLDCLGEVADCGTYRHCNGEDDPRVTACGADEDAGRCDGDYLVHCSVDAPDQGEDCAAAGLVCGQQGQRANCGDVHCDPASPPTCDGSVETSCWLGTTVRSDCRAFLAETCRGALGGVLRCQTMVRPICGVDPDPDAEGDITCLSDGPPCPDDLEPHCEGEVFVTCDQGRVSRTDCSTLPGTPQHCDAVGVDLPDRHVVGCLRPPPECTVEDPESCDGSRIRFCHQGRRATFDCASLGLANCVVETSALADQDVARCAE